MRVEDISIWKQAIEYRLGSLKRHTMIFHIGFPKKGFEFLTDFESLLKTREKIPGENLSKYILGIIRRDVEGYNIRILGNSKLVSSFYEAFGSIGGTVKLSEIERLNNNVGDSVFQEICKLLSISLITSQESPPMISKYPKELIKEISDYLNKVLNTFCKGKAGEKYV